MDKNINKKLKELEVLFLDADGVFFDGQENLIRIGKNTTTFKSRSYQDGQGLSFLRELGIRIVFVSGEGEPLNTMVKKFNELPSAINNKWKLIEVFSNRNTKGSKLKAIKKWLDQNKVSPSKCTYMGDDVNDFEPINFIKNGNGLIVAPANATRKIMPIANIVTRNNGGHGAIREFVEMILDAQEINESTLPLA